MNNYLYVVGYPDEPEFAEAWPIEVEHDYDNFVSCPLCGERVSGALWKRPREVVLTSRKVPDFLYAYCDNVPFVISQNAIGKIQEAGLKGITVAEEIETVRFQRKSKTETPIPKYYHVELARSRITINHEKSNIVYQPSASGKSCQLCRQVPAMYNFFRKLILNTDCYEGYDIFHIYEMGDAVFLSQKFVDFYKESGLTNLHFNPAETHDQQAVSYFLGDNEYD